MRVLSVVPSVNEVTGGPAWSALKLAEQLVKQGCSVDMFSTQWPQTSLPKKSYTQAGLRIELFPAHDFLPGIKIPYSFELVNAIKQRISKYDVVHLHSLWNPLISHATRVARMSGKPYGITAHGMLDPIVFGRNRQLKRIYAALWEQANVENATLVHFCTEAERQKADLCGWTIKQSLIIANQVDVGFWESLPSYDLLEEREPRIKNREVIAFVGRIDWVKNLDILIDAISLLRNNGRNVALVCAGPDNSGYQRVLLKKLEDLRLQDSVFFLGHQSREELKSVYSRAQVSALVSKKENFGLAAAEALSAGLPIVLSDGVDMGKNWPCPPVWRTSATAESIADSLSSALDFRPNYKKPCLNSRGLAQNEFRSFDVSVLIDSYSRARERTRDPA